MTEPMHLHMVRAYDWPERFTDESDDLSEARGIIWCVTGYAIFLVGSFHILSGAFVLLRAAVRAVVG